MKRISTYVLCALLGIGCANTTKQDCDDTIYVTIAPLTEIVKSITGDDFPVEVLVPAGASPETFEPTPRQIVAINRSQALFSVGLLDFEKALTQRLQIPNKVIDLSRGIEPIAGSCSHTHGQHTHNHGVDPHIWTSPRQLITMAANAYEAIATMYPDSIKYRDNYLIYSEKLRQLDESCAAACDSCPRRCFVVFHPALTYFARDYGMEQIAIEHEGKEPAIRQLGNAIEQARRSGVKRVFYQSQFPRSTVETVASDIGAECVEIDPLRPDVSDNIIRITRLITEQ